MMPAVAAAIGFAMSEAGQLVADLLLAATSPGYDAVDGSDASQIIITFKPDGTWTITAPGESLTGTPLTGRWAVAGVNPAMWELQFVTANLVNSPSISNGASSFSPMTQDRVLSVSKTSGTASADVTVNLKPAGAASTMLTDTTNLSASGSGGGVVGVSPVGTTIP